jgi:hypothetical protein
MERDKCGKSEWHKETSSDGSVTMTKVVDPKIQAKMPPSGSRTFIEVGPIKTLVIEIKKFLKGEPNFLG